MTACLHLSNRSSLEASIIREASAAKRDLFRGCSIASLSGLWFSQCSGCSSGCFRIDYYVMMYSCKAILI